ncbi:MAG: lipase family protein [Pseudomonadota bacterium]
MRQIRFKLAALGAASLLVACGGGDTVAPLPVVTGAITGLAATGAALANASITARCVSGDPITGRTNADGSFALEIRSPQTAPCLVQVSNGSVTLYSYASASGRINVTPLTDLVVARALGSDPAAAFASFDVAKAATLRLGLDSAKAYVKALVIGQVGSAPAGDPISGIFAIGDATDKVLDAVGQSLTAGGKTFADLRNSVLPSGIAAATAARGKLIGTPTTVTTLTAAQITGAATQSGLIGISGPAVCDVKVVALNYNTVGVVGESTNASGVLLVPTGACTPNGALLAYAKGTDMQKPRTLANPSDSETFLLAAVYAAQGFNVVATDYLGFAQSNYKYHPYLHADSEASSVIDSIRAARNAAAAAGSTITGSGKVMLAGYSQGGHSSMAAHRAIERDNSAEINVVAGAHLAGPYNLSGSFKSGAAIAGYQYFVTYLVTAWQKVYGNIYSDVNAAFKPAYATGIETLLPSPTLNATTLVTTGKLPGGPTVSPAQARDALFQAAFIADTQTNNNNALYLAGKKNDLLGWNPKSRVLLCGGAGDPTVPPALHQVAMKADFDSRQLTNVSSVDVDAFIQATYGPAPTDPTSPAFATYYGSYHGSYEPPFCHAQAKASFDAVK